MAPRSLDNPFAQTRRPADRYLFIGSLLAAFALGTLYGSSGCDEGTRSRAASAGVADVAALPLARIIASDCPTPPLCPMCDDEVYRRDVASAIVAPPVACPTVAACRCAPCPAPPPAPVCPASVASAAAPPPDLVRIVASSSPCPAAAAAAASSAPAPALTATAGDGGGPCFRAVAEHRQPVQGVTVLADLREAAERVKNPMRWGRPIVAFVSGNDAMVKFMLNEMRWIDTFAVPFSVLWVPLDEAGVEHLRRKGNGTVWSGMADGARFAPGRSGFREKEYNRMALAKWEVLRRLLELDYDVLLLDPDLVLLRNPLPYFETLPSCDLTLSMDSTVEPTWSNVVSRGGFAFSLGGMDNMFNTGGGLFRSSPRTRAFVEAYYAHAEREYAGNTHFDDQHIFNTYVNGQHAVQKERVGETSNGQYAIDRVFSNECYEYRRNDGDGSTVASVYPLNPGMFMPRPLIVDKHWEKQIAHLPFWWHANYCDSDADKVKEIRWLNHWLADWDEWPSPMPPRT